MAAAGGQPTIETDHDPLAAGDLHDGSATVGSPRSRRSLRSPAVPLALAGGAIASGALFDIFGPDLRRVMFSTTSAWAYSLVLPWICVIVAGAFVVRAWDRMALVAGGAVGGLVAMVVAIQVGGAIAGIDGVGIAWGDRLAMRIVRMSPWELHVNARLDTTESLRYALGLAVVGAVLGALVTLVISGFDRSAAPAAGAAVVGAAVLGIQPIIGEIADGPFYTKLVGLIGPVVMLAIAGMAAALDARVPAPRAVAPGGAAVVGGDGRSGPVATAPGGLAPTNAFAVVALVLGLLGGNLLAVIFGHVARSQIRRTGERGEGMALAGLILGYLGLALGVVVMLLALSSGMG